MTNKNFKNTGLGRGLGALLNSADIDVNEKAEEKIVLLDINDVSPMPGQPRKIFNQEELEELADSIKVHGVLQPIIVNKGKTAGMYLLIAGERRWRASRLANKKKIPAIVKNIDELTSLQHSIIENIQRIDLSPMEEAVAFKYLQDEYAMTQEELAESLGKKRSTIANILRLNQLSEYAKEMLNERKITAGHARAILGLDTEELQNKATKIIIRDSLNVRETEKIIKRIKDQAVNKSRVKKITKHEEQYRLEIKSLEEKLTKELMTKVDLKDRKGKGSIVIKYTSNDELERILEMILVKGKK